MKLNKEDINDLGLMFACGASGSGLLGLVGLCTNAEPKYISASIITGVISYVSTMICVGRVAVLENNERGYQ